jgi:hypothetical protein
LRPMQFLDIFAVCGRALSECIYNLFNRVPPVSRLQAEIVTQMSLYTIIHWICAPSGGLLGHGTRPNSTRPSA